MSRLILATLAGGALLIGAGPAASKQPGRSHPFVVLAMGLGQ